jgi:hypothetical protein
MRFQKMKFVPMVLTLLFAGQIASGDDHALREVCKAECPTAKTEDEAHRCMDEVVKKKKGDKKFRKSDCFAAHRDHEKHEKAEGDGHSH